MSYWGYHLRVDAAGCDLTKVSSVDYVRNYNDSLLSLIEMKSMGAPWIEDCGPEDRPDLCGITVLQPIETSSISAHFCNLSGDAYLDVFSCKPFEDDAVVTHFRDWFGPQKVRYDFTVRQA
ncbi:MAG: S-adenosylmethionine decarboxylase [Rhodospirillaceae bacterium]|nr:S-adenosylmethionine decarboxylase [Rhodospirillaceae bacterium]MCA8934365.1 S-adenosylmethionine decarboxylase [Rhodospirillaceae bacterium]